MNAYQEQAEEDFHNALQTLDISISQLAIARLARPSDLWLKYQIGAGNFSLLVEDLHDVEDEKDVVKVLLKWGFDPKDFGIPEYIVTAVEKEE